MELANMAFYFERSGRRTVLGKHMRKRNLKEKVNSLLDEKRGKRSILGRYLNDVVRHTPYTRQEDEPEIHRPAAQPENKTGHKRIFGMMNNFDDYMDLAYCADVQSASEDSFSDSDELCVRQSGDGSETPDTEASAPIDTVARDEFVYRDRVVIGAESYTSQQTVYIDNRDDFIMKHNVKPAGAKRHIDVRRNKRVGFVIADEINILENHQEVEERSLFSQYQTVKSSQVERKDISPLRQQTTVVDNKACACGSDAMRMPERNLEQRLDTQQEVTSLKNAMKRKTKNKIQILLNMYKSRKSQIKLNKKKSTSQPSAEDSTKMVYENDSLMATKSQTDDNEIRDSFNYAFCDESSKVVGPCDRNRNLNSAFVARNIGGSVLHFDNSTINRSSYQNEYSHASLCTKSSCEDFVYFNNGFILE